jgi:hypothetical protein
MPSAVLTVRPGKPRTILDATPLLGVFRLSTFWIKLMQSYCKAIASIPRLGLAGLPIPKDLWKSVLYPRNKRGCSKTCVSRSVRFRNTASTMRPSITTTHLPSADHHCSATATTPNQPPYHHHASPNNIKSIPQSCPSIVQIHPPWYSS